MSASLYKSRTGPVTVMWTGARQIRPDKHDALVLCSIGGALAVRRADLPPPLDQLQGSGTDANRLWRRAGGISALWHALTAGARRLDRKLRARRGGRGDLLVRRRFWSRPAVSGLDPVRSWTCPWLFAVGRNEAGCGAINGLLCGRSSSQCRHSQRRQLPAL